MSDPIPSELASLRRLGHRYLLTPVCLVPNGRAHLGHIAGPLLRMDILRRYLKWAGADAHLVALSDSHESHVAVQAYKEGRSPEEVARDYHAQIAADFAALDLEYDAFIDPLAPEWSQRYEEFNQRYLDLIVAAGNTSIKEEFMPRLVGSVGDAVSPAPRADEFVVNGWLRGECPVCEVTLAGFFCESCGGCFSPSQIVNPRPAHTSGEVELVAAKSLYLNIPGGRAALDEAFARAGVGCHMVAAERYAELTGRVNPFEADSGTELVLSFGIDNTVGYLLGGIGTALSQDTYKPVDHVLGNYFFTLNGKKFSTSRRHVIWARDLVEVGEVDSDIARAYLCKKNPEFEQQDFDTNEFADFYDALASRLNEVMTVASAAVVPGTTASSVELGLLSAYLRQLDIALDPSTHSLRRAWSVVERWMELASASASTPQSAFVFLLGLIHLTGPFMPNFSRRLAASLGRDGEYTIDSLENPEPLHQTPDVIGLHLEKLNREAFSKSVQLENKIGARP